MAAEPDRNVQKHVLERVGYFAAESGQLEERHLFELFPDAWDFIDLCEDLEKAYGINLRPFFENGQPEFGWGPWKQKAARDVTASELANHVAALVSGRLPNSQ